MKKILFPALAALILALCVPVITSCEGNKPVDVVVTDYGYTVSIDDAHLGTDGNAVCFIRLTKGGSREESVTVNYKIDDDLSLRLKVNGKEIASGTAVAFDMQGQMKLELPELPEGRHTLHLILKNKYNKEYSKDISFNVIRDKVLASAITAPATLRIEKGSALDTAVVLSPADADDKGIGVTSSDPTKVTASLKGDGARKTLHIEAVEEGTATLSFSHADLGASAAKTAVEVYSYAIAGLKDITLYETQEQRLSLSVSPAAPITLTASNANVSVTEEGSNTWVVRGISAGEAVLSAKSGVTVAQAHVTVKQPQISGMQNLSLNVGEEATLSLSVEPQMNISLTSASTCVAVAAAGTNVWKLKAVSEGTARLTAKAGSASVTATVTVSKKPESIAVSPMSATLAWGQTKTFTVSSTSAFTATVSDPGAKIVEVGTASVSIRNNSSAYTDTKVTLTLVNKTDETKKAVADITLEKKKETVTLTETSSAPGVSVWTVGGENGGWELTATPSGVTKQVEGNTITLTNATYKAIKGRISVKTKAQGVEASSEVSVPALEASLEFLTAEASAVTFHPGESITVKIRGRYSDKSEKDVTELVSWTYPQNMQRDGNRFTATAVGSGNIVASIGALTAKVYVAVTQAPAVVEALRIEPSWFSAVVGESRSFTANAVMSDGTTRDVSNDCEWTIAGPCRQIAKGYIVTTATGEILVEALYAKNGVKLTARATGMVTKVSGTVTGVEINPSSASVKVGETVSFQGTVRYSDGSTDASGNFRVSNSGILAGSDGSYVALSEGTCDVIYFIAGYSATAKVTVTRDGGDNPGGGDLTVSSVSLNRSSLSLLVGRSASLSATARMSDGSVKDVTYAADWTSSNGSVASTDGYGGVAGVSAGSARITASYGGKSASCSVTVSAEASLTGISVSPASISAQVGDSPVSLTVQGRYSDGTMKDVSGAASFSSSNTSVAKVSGRSVSFIGAGSATISVSYGGASASVPVSVTKSQQYTTKITLNETSVTLKVGDTYQIDGTVYCENPSQTYPVKSVCSFSSSNTSVAAVSSGGKVTAKGEGTAVITVENLGVTATLSVRVTPGETSKTLSLSPTSLSWSASETGAKTVTVTSNGSWTVSVSTSNFSINKTSGSGNGSFTVTRSKANTGSSAITGTVTVSVQGGPSATVSLSQAGTSSVAVTGVSLDKTSLSLTAGGAGAQLTATVSPSNASNKTVTWSSSNTAVATVSGNGYVTPKAAGEATVTVKTADGGKTATCKVKVAAGTVDVTGVKINEGNFEITPGATKQLSATVTPSNATNKTVTWTSDNSSVAKVSSSGLVTGVAAGTTYINAKAGTHTDYVKVTVKSSVVKVESVTINEPDQTINVGASFQYTVTVKPDNASDKSVSWTSNNTSVATVDATGRVSGVSAGTAKISAVSRDGSGRSATRTVTVKKVDYSIVASPSSLEWGYNETGKKTVSLQLANIAAADLQVSLSGDSNYSYSLSGTTLSVNPKSGNESTAERKATLTIKDKNNKASTTVALRQAGKPAATLTSIEVSPSSVTVKEGETATISATPKDQYGQTISASLSWKSDNGAVATVSGGKVTGVKAGSTSVYAYSGSVQSAKVNVTVTEIAVTGITLNPTTLSMNPGDTKTITATVSPANASNKTVTWTSSNTGVATVDAYGAVTAKAKGEATITAKAGGKTATCKVTVIEKTVAVTGVSLNKTSIELTEGTYEQLTATVSPNNATNKNVTWSSSNTSVATVNGGKVTAVKEGTANITVRTEDGGKTASCSVRVLSKTVAVTGVSLNRTNITLTEGDTEGLIATVSPSNATNQNVTWTSSNTGVVTVSSTGSLKAVKAGSATITVKTVDGGKTATCSVEVKAKEEKKEIRFTRNPSVSVLEYEKKVLDYELKYYVNGKETSFPASSTYTITFVSDNTSSVTVAQENNKWTVTGVKEGQAKIKAQMFIKSGGATLVTDNHINVSVSKSVPTTVTVTSPTLNGNYLNMGVGDTEQLTATVKNQNGGTMVNPSVTWKSGNPAVVSVSGSGASVTLTAKAAGYTQVTATSGSATTTINVNVEATVEETVTGIYHESNASDPSQFKVFAEFYNSRTQQTRTEDVTKDVTVSGVSNGLTVTKQSPSPGIYWLQLSGNASSGTFTISYGGESITLTAKKTNGSWMIY